jgi:hypothetical protein
MTKPIRLYDPGFLQSRGQPHERIQVDGDIGMELHLLKPSKGKTELGQLPYPSGNEQQGLNDTSSPKSALKRAKGQP